MEETKKKRWNWAVILCVALLGLSLWQGKRISDLEQAVWTAQSSVIDNVDRISQRVSSLSAELESAGDLVRDWSYESAVNTEKRGLDIKVSLVLKEWQADTVVKLFVKQMRSDSDASETVVPLSGDGAGVFTGTMPLMLYELSGEYTLDAVIANNDTQRRESLGYLGDAAGLLPLQCYGWGVAGPVYDRNADKSGMLTVDHCEAELTGLDGNPSELSDQVFRLRRGGKVAAEKAAVSGDRIGQYTCEELSAEVWTGDRLALTFFCRDASGLGYEFFLDGWSIEEGGLGREIAPETDYPRLTWD